jgi:hypothetical protein
MNASLLSLKTHPSFKKRILNSTIPLPKDDQFPSLTLALFSLWEILRQFVSLDPISGDPKLKLPADYPLDFDVLNEIKPFCVS